MVRILYLIALLTGMLAATARSQAPAVKKMEMLATQQVARQCAACKIDITGKWIPAGLTQADSSGIQFLQFTDTALPRGYQTADVTYQSGGELKTETVQMHVKVIKKLPVARQRISGGQLITEDDLDDRWVDLTRMKRLPVMERDRIVGYSLNRMVTGGTPFYQRDLELQTAINAGEPVEMVYKTAGVNVLISGVARQSKGEGEIIRIYSKETRKTYLAEVVNSNKVIWKKTL